MLDTKAGLYKASDRCNYISSNFEEIFVNFCFCFDFESDVSDLTHDQQVFQAGI